MFKKTQFEKMLNQRLETYLKKRNLDLYGVVCLPQLNVKKLKKTHVALTIFKQLLMKPLCPPSTILHFDQPEYYWKSMKDVEREIEIRSKECRDCGSPYDTVPCETGLYDGNNEPVRFQVC